jgi:hypothetical protein
MRRIERSISPSISYFFLLNAQKDTTAAGRYWEIFDTTINLLFIINYVIQTMLDWSLDQSFFQIIDVSLSGLLLVQFLPHLYISFDRVGKLFSMFALLSFASTLPVFWAFGNGVDGTFFGIGNTVYW